MSSDAFENGHSLHPPSEGEEAVLEEARSALAQSHEDVDEEQKFWELVLGSGLGHLATLDTISDIDFGSFVITKGAGDLYDKKETAEQYFKRMFAEITSDFTAYRTQGFTTSGGERKGTVSRYESETLGYMDARDLMEQVEKLSLDELERLSYIIGDKNFALFRYRNQEVLVIRTEDSRFRVIINTTKKDQTIYTREFVVGRPDERIFYESRSLTDSLGRKGLVIHTKGNTLKLTGKSKVKVPMLKYKRSRKSKQNSVADVKEHFRKVQELTSFLRVCNIESYDIDIEFIDTDCPI